MESDERDDRELPTAGYCVKMTQEVAGFGGDTIFGKAEMKSEVYKELLKDWVKLIVLFQLAAVQVISGWCTVSCHPFCNVN